MKILVTGSAGFIGSHLCERLLVLGHEVVGVDNFSNGNWRWVHTYPVDIEGPWDAPIETKPSYLYERRFDVIFHLAATGSVPRSFIHPQTYFHSNVAGVLELIIQDRNTNIPFGADKLVFASSSSVYGDNGDFEKVIGNEGWSLSPYATTKRAGEDLIRQLWTGDNKQYFNLRFFNVYGPRQRHDHPYSAVIPKWIDSIYNENAITVYGDASAVSRDFTYVDDVVDALVACLDANGSHTLNVGAGRPNSLQQVIGELARVTNRTFKIVNNPARKGDIKHSQANIELTHAILGWKPKTSLQEGIQKTVEWYAHNIGIPKAG